MDGKIRRIVTGHDESGRSIVQEDGIAPSILVDKNRPGRFVTQVIVTDELPARLDVKTKIDDRKVTLEPPANGAAFKVIELPPKAIEQQQAADAEKVRQSFAQMGHDTGNAEASAKPHAYMHRTNSLDYGIVLSGEAYLILDEGEVLMRTGDVVIQNGTSHSWRNDADMPCQLVFFMMGGRRTPELDAVLGASDQ